MNSNNIFKIEYSINNNNIYKYNSLLPTNIINYVHFMLTNNLSINGINTIKNFLYWLMYDNFDLNLNDFNTTNYMDAIIFSQYDHLLIFSNVNNDIILYYLTINDNFNICSSCISFNDILKSLLIDDINLNFSNMNIT
jgi:hypothetical protein